LIHDEDLRAREPVLNRHERRRSAALTRGRRTGYLHRVMAALGDGPTPGVHLATIEHDHGCGIYRGRGCDCVPDISVSDPHGGVTVVDERGNATRMRKQ
jgi:hypothetical protein